jgi:hypothetical protein
MLQLVEFKIAKNISKKKKIIIKKNLATLNHDMIKPLILSQNISIAPPRTDELLLPLLVAQYQWL